MTTRRQAKIAEAIREQVSTSILFDLRDPRIQGVTVLRIEVSPDVRSAKVYVSVLGDEKAEQLCLHGLNSARGFLQSKVADRIKTRNTPILQFVIDKSVKKSVEAARLIREAIADEALTDEALTDEAMSDWEHPEEEGPPSDDETPRETTD